jgi:hypothetical protein
MFTSIAVSLCIVLAGEAPALGDLNHGESLLKAADQVVRVDGAWLNRYSDEAIVSHLQKGKEDFPRVESENVLDAWDVLAVLRERNSGLKDLAPDATHVFVAETTLDSTAKTRLMKKGNVPEIEIQESRRVFVAYSIKEADADVKKKQIVGPKENKKRDKLKPVMKTGYVVFAVLDGFRDGKYEVAFSIDGDIRLTKAMVRDASGNLPADVNQAAQRFVGRGVRGAYEELKAGGAGRAVAELTVPLSRAFLKAAEAIYAFEAEESDYFAFD